MCVRVYVCVVRRRRAHATETRHTRVVRTQARVRACERASEPPRPAHEGGTRPTRKGTRPARFVDLTGSRKGGSWIRSAASGGRGRERERPEEETSEGIRERIPSLVRSFASCRFRKAEKWKRRGSITSFSLSLPLDLYSPSLDGLRRRKKVKDRFSGRRGS